MDPAGAVFDGVQVISQMRGNQTVRFRNHRLSLSQYFDRYADVVQSYRRRGGQPITVWISSARLFVQAHGKKRFVIALKYEGESEYRYLVASDLTWRTEDIVQAFTLRWLVEVFIQDWKGYEGWGALTKQPGEEGSSRGLILSLLVDHCLLLHPAQLAQLNHRQPAFTV
nr:transposase [Gammaproteobacteria bacterium]